MRSSFILLAMFIALCSVVMGGPAVHGIPYERIEIDRPVAPLARGYGWNGWGAWGNYAPYGRGVGWNGAYNGLRF